MNRKIDILKSKDYNEFLKTQLKLNKNADTQVLEFIHRFVWKQGDKTIAKSLDKQFVNGYCWYFANILQMAFQKGKVCWASPRGHCVWVYNNIAYDVEGVYKDPCVVFIPFSELKDLDNDFKHILNVQSILTEQEIAKLIYNWQENHPNTKKIFQVKLTTEPDSKVSNQKI